MKKVGILSNGKILVEMTPTEFTVVSLKQGDFSNTSSGSATRVFKRAQPSSHLLGEEQCPGEPE